MRLGRADELAVVLLNFGGFVREPLRFLCG
jgi:hypothetical protein